MALFVIMAPQPNADLDAAVTSRFEGNSFRISDSSWIVSATGVTSRQISERLSISSPDGAGPNSPAAVIAGSGGYWGSYPTGLWEWIKVKLESPNG